MAVKLVVLPKGTIKTEIFCAAEIKGFVAKEIKDSNTGRAFDKSRKDNLSGKIRITPQQIAYNGKYIDVRKFVFTCVYVYIYIYIYI